MTATESCSPALGFADSKVSTPSAFCMAAGLRVSRKIQLRWSCSSDSVRRLVTAGVAATGRGVATAEG